MEIYGEIFLKNSILQYDVAASLPSCTIWYDGKFSDYKIPPWCLYAIGMTSCRSKSSSCLPDALRYLDNVALSKSHHNDATPLASSALFRCYDKCGCQTGSDPTKKMVTDDTTQTFLTKNYRRKTFRFFRAFSFRFWEWWRWWTNRWNARPDFDFPGDRTDANRRFANRFPEGAVHYDFFQLFYQRIFWVILKRCFVGFLVEK